MSLNIPVKILHNSEIRKISRIPKSIDDLRSEITRVHGHSNFGLKYFDDENDLITISTDQELIEAYMTAVNLKLPSLKIILDDVHTDRIKEDTKAAPNHVVENVMNFDESYLKSIVRIELEKSIGYNRSQGPIWQNHSCDGCKAAQIIGTRYHCTVCPDLDYCELCEATLSHAHPFLKLKSLNSKVSVSVNLVSPKCITKTWKNIRRFISPIKPKMQFVDHVNMKGCDSYEPGSAVFKIWRVKNNGNFR